MDKQSYYRTLTILGSIIILLVVFVVSLLMNPNVETQIVEDPKEVIVETEIVVEVDPQYIYNVAPEERELIARIVYREANTESLKCQKAVASVIINRWQNGTWGDNIEDVIYSPGQFSTASLVDTTTPTNENYEAVDHVLRYGCTIPSYVMYFRADHGFSKTWDHYKEYKRMGNTYFGYFKKDR